jgi:hypothetical protein
METGGGEEELIPLWDRSTSRSILNRPQWPMTSRHEAGALRLSGHAAELRHVDDLGLRQDRAPAEQETTPGSSCGNQPRVVEQEPHSALRT